MRWQVRTLLRNGSAAAHRGMSDRKRAPQLSLHHQAIALIALFFAHCAPVCTADSVCEPLLATSACAQFYPSNTSIKFDGSSFGCQTDVEQQVFGGGTQTVWALLQALSPGSTVRQQRQRACRSQSCNQQVTHCVSSWCCVCVMLVLLGCRSTHVHEHVQTLHGHGGLVGVSLGGGRHGLVLSGHSDGTAAAAHSELCKHIWSMRAQSIVQ